jgi:hypothetical protein
MKLDATLGVGSVQILLHHKNLQYPHSSDMVPSYDIMLIGNVGIIICQYPHWFSLKKERMK